MRTQWSVARSTLRVVLAASAVFALLALRSLPAAAETDAVFGFKGGVSVSHYEGAGIQGEVHSGAVLGVQLAVPASRYFSVQGEALYHEKGARRVQIGTIYRGQDQPELPVLVDSRRTYLELLLLAKLALPEFGGYVLAGPAFGALLSSGDTFAEDYSHYRTLHPYPESPTSWYRDDAVLSPTANAEGSLLGGIGCAVPVGENRLLVEARYQWGLQNINRWSSRDVSIRSLTLLAGVEF